MVGFATELDVYYFSLKVFAFSNFILINHTVNGFVNTKNLQKTGSVLGSKLPSIFSNFCENYKKQSFRKEAVETEIGHLLEHMILEYMKLETEKKGKYADFSGETCWDWKKQKPGRFNIKINCPESNLEEFKNALPRAISLLESIYKESEKTPGQDYSYPEIAAN